MSLRDANVSNANHPKRVAIVVAGAQAPMFTSASADGLQRKFVEFYLAGRIAAALCNGVAILNYAPLPDGKYLVEGKTVTGQQNFSGGETARLVIEALGR